MSARRLFFVFLLLIAPAAAQTLRVAVAADFGRAMKRLAAEYEKKSPVKIEIITGASGTLFAQIQNGAPFDLFFSADADYPQKLVDAGLAEADMLKTYAIGQIGLWIPRSRLGDDKLRPKLWLTRSWVKKIAIANPEHAPYGRAAVAALRSMGLYDTLKDKIVLGENVAQAAQFVESGNADLAIISTSMWYQNSMMEKGVFVLLHETDYPPIIQKATVISSSKQKAAAQSFLDFVTGDEGREIIQYRGYKLP